MNYERSELSAQLADEYVLGLLQGAARRRFERLLQQSARLRQAVAASNARLHLLLEPLPPVAPPAYVWSAIQRRIEPPRAAPRQGLWEMTGFWRGLAFAAVLLAFSLGLYTWIRPQTDYVIVVTADADAQTGWILHADIGADELVVQALQPQTIPPDRVFQLWMKPTTEAGVLPVGLLPIQGRVRMVLPGSLKVDMAELFGVSVEPPGGSPTGQPTTPPLYHGKPMVF